jgi:hypothetical protein
VICFQIFDTNLVLSQQHYAAKKDWQVVICFQIFDTNLVLSQPGADAVEVCSSCDLLSDF